MSQTVDTSNKEFQDALSLIQYTRQSVFLTGKAGTGKSTFLRYICENIKKKHVVLAPTGIAAINAGGSTLHSFFKLPFHPLLPDDPNLSLQRGRIHEFFRYTKPQRKLLEELELIIIDEISMVRADIIDAVDRILRVYSRNLREPFGGKQLLLVPLNLKRSIAKQTKSLSAFWTIFAAILPVPLTCNYSTPATEPTSKRMRKICISPSLRAAIT